MTVALLWDSLWPAIVQILEAVSTLLPAPIAYGLYKEILLGKSLPLEEASPSKRRQRLVLHAAVAIGIVVFIHLAFGSSCPTDEDGECIDEDWKPVTSTQSARSLMRMIVLTLGGMSLAYYRYSARKT